MLIDTYAGATHRELFANPSFRIAQIIDHKTAYGVVIGGDSMRLRHCFYGYMRSHRAEIFSRVKELVKPIEVSLTIVRLDPLCLKRSLIRNPLGCGFYWI